MKEVEGDMVSARFAIEGAGVATFDRASAIAAQEDVIWFEAVYVLNTPNP
jgi:hypothetical protein